MGAVPSSDAETRIDEYVSTHLEGWFEELAHLCAVPSVSARHEAVEECAELVAALLRKRGFEADVTPSGGHPVVLAHAEGSRARPALLFYNHYDVQPPEPVELWETPPFELSRRDGALFARGSKDDKGELVARLAALDAVRAVDGDYPCSITFLVEGEEEVGSPNLPEWVERHRDRLRVDAAIWEEGGVDPDGTPYIRLGARGLLYVELSVRTLSRDAHSGLANLLPNAAWRLVWALATLKGQRERVLIDGFYDAVRKPSARIEQLLAKLPSDEESVRRVFGIERLLLDRQGAAVPRAPFEPTCNIAGIGAGYQGPGSKTVIPAGASAKLDFRLVPDQDPDDILAKLRLHLDQKGFRDVQIEVHGAERPGAVDPDAALVELAARTAEEVYGRPPRVYPLSGGTTPMYLFTEKGVPVIAPGVGYDDNRAHSPNEHVRILDFEQAVRHLARVVRRFGRPQQT
jgi:acetylornithine deacetylase/succinyl-diaminopimelate desuccinylase-like protein